MVDYKFRVISKLSHDNKVYWDIEINYDGSNHWELYSAYYSAYNDKQDAINQVKILIKNRKERKEFYKKKNAFNSEIINEKDIENV